MRDLTENQLRDAATSTMEDFINKLKTTPGYSAYEHAVKKEDKDTHKFLQMSTMLFSMADEELHAMMMAVSLDLLFAMADQRLRAEILGNQSE